MDGCGNQLLAGARFAANKNIEVTLCNPGDLFPDSAMQVLLPRNRASHARAGGGRSTTVSQAQQQHDAVTQQQRDARAQLFPLQIHTVVQLVGPTRQRLDASKRLMVRRLPRTINCSALRLIWGSSSGSGPCPSGPLKSRTAPPQDQRRVTRLVGKHRPVPDARGVGVKNNGEHQFLRSVFTGQGGDDRGQGQIRVSGRQHGVRRPVCWFKNSGAYATA